MKDFLEMFPFLSPLGLLIFGSVLMVCIIVGFVWPVKTQGRTLPVVFSLTICLFISKPILIIYALIGSLFFGSGYWQMDSIFFKASLVRYLTLTFVFILIFQKFRAVGLLRIQKRMSNKLYKL